MNTKLLQGIPLFASLEEDEIKVIASRIQLRQWPQKRVIMNEGESSDSLYIILSGKVKIFLLDESGEEIILNFLHEGDYFGEVSLFDDSDRSASVMTLTDACFAVLQKKDFLALMSSHPELALTIIKGLTMRLRGLTGSVRNLALMDVYGRVAHTLLELAVEKDSQRVILENLTYEELAKRVGASTKMVGRVMKDLKTGGYITKTGKRLVINQSFPSSW